MLKYRIGILPVDAIMRFATGARLGAFEILAPLGAGGMGEVYRARDTRLDRVVAIKLLSSEIVNATGRGVDRFRQEARAIARITHPNICTLHDLGEDDSSIFLVMEYVDGATLADRLEDGPLPLPLALSTAIQIADALDHAHRHGVVHRDLTPRNIMLTRDRVKLLDFGLAKLKERDEELPAAGTQSARLTEVGAIVGTVPYMSPEQIEGDDVDSRTDIFSFGVVVYEMVCGRRPFAGDSRAALMATIVAAEPPPPSTLRPETSAPLERLILRALAKDPDDRWQTARDLAAELRWIAEETGSARPSTVARRPSRAVLWSAAAGAVLGAAVLAAIGWSMWPTPALVQFQQVTYRRGVVSSARFAPDGRSFVYSASWEGQPYASFLARAQSPDARDLQLEETRILSISRDADMAVLFSPQDISRAYGTRTLARIPMAGGARRDLLTGVADADWIPGTDTYAVIRDPGGGRPWTVEFPVGKTVHETRFAWSLRVSPNGGRVAFLESATGVFDSTPDAMITIIDASGRKSTVARGLSGIGLAWAPSGNEIWFTAARPSEQSAGPTLHAVTLAGVERTVYSAPDWLVLHDISADGRVLLSRNSIRINVACQRPGEASERQLGWLVASFAAGLSADGQTLIFADPLSGRTLAGDATVFRRSTDGSAAVALGEARGAGPLSPDGRWVLAEQRGNRVLLPTGAGSTVTLPKGEIMRFGRGAWLSDSKRFVFTGDTGDGKPRGYIQEIPDGLPQAITPEGVALAAKGTVRDDHTLLGRVGPRWALYSIQGGEAQPVTALRPTDVPMQWSADGRGLYTIDNVGQGGAPAAAIDVHRVELATGARTLWRTLSPPDPVGVQGLRPTVEITSDARSYCYSYMRRLGDLYVVNGLK